MAAGPAAASEALGEVFALARTHGIAPEKLLEVVNGRRFRSPAYENYGRLIAAERYEPAGFGMPGAAHPPAIAGMTVTSSPSARGAANPPRKRTSSSFR